MHALLLLLSPLANAADLPGISLSFEVDSEGRWLLPTDLPTAFAQAGAEPGWVLSGVDGRPFSDPEAARRMVAAGPAREVQLLFTLPPEPPPDPPAGAAPPAGGEAPKEEPPPPEEAVLVVQRSPLIHVVELGLLPWPEGFSQGVPGWKLGPSGEPLLLDARGRAWAFDARSGAQTESPLEPQSPLEPPEVFWGLSGGDWVIERGEELETGNAAWAKSQLHVASRLPAFQDRAGDHLLLPGMEGLQVLTVEWPQGTYSLPVCDPLVPETCLASGRQIQIELAGVQGGLDEALRHLEIACTRGVYRGCYEAVALEDPDVAVPARACLEGDVAACHSVAADRLRREPEAPSQRTVGVLEFACNMDASGDLGDRIRRVEDVGEGCALLSSAYDRLGVTDRALLSLDQACVLGRADACDEAAHRRHLAFASRTVRECEHPELPVAEACVELGLLLQVEPVASATVSDFEAFLRGCKLGDEQGCVLLGDYVDRWGIENPQVIQAEEELMNACEQGEQRACLGAAHLLVRHEPRSDAYGRALVTFSGACEAGLSNACIAGAQQRRIGDARSVKAPEPEALWEDACDLQSGQGCAGLGAFESRAKAGWADAFAAWTRACDLGEAPSCTELGLFVERRHGDPWPGEQPADSYLERGCQIGDPGGCYWLAEDDLPRRGEPPEAAYLLLERSCEGEDGQGCAALADVHLDRRTSFDDEIAARHLQTACDNGHFDSCQDLSEMFLRGKGVERDRAKAKELAERFEFNAPRKLLRLGPQLGFPYLIGLSGELVLPIPVGPALSLAGSGSYLPKLGSALTVLEGQDNPEDDPDLLYFDLTARVYPANNKARGFYLSAGYHNLSTQGGSVDPPLTRAGFSLRFGLHSEGSKLFYNNVELGLAQYGSIELSDFDEDETASFPLIQPVLGFSFGFSLL